MDFSVNLCASFITENTFSDDTQKNHYYLFHSLRQEQYSLLAKDGSIWLNQNQMAEFFDTSTPNISIHISEILKDKVLQGNTVVKHYLTTASDGKIIWLRSILWRRSLQLGSECAVLRQWANRNLAEYMHKGFVMDDECLKKTDGRPDYFDELLERIRDIRASEKRF